MNKFTTLNGGQSNTSSGDFSIVGGGRNNIADGVNSGILGGRNNTINSHSSSFIIGSNLSASSDNTTYTNNLHVSSSLVTSFIEPGYIQLQFHILLIIKKVECFGILIILTGYIIPIKIFN